ncbi:MAG: Uma2 family endonuclease [Planctomycetota bacterium]
MNVVAEKGMTFDEYLERHDGRAFDLVNGELVENHVSALSSHVAAEVIALVAGHCRRNGAGVVFTSECCYRCFADPDTGRRPDVSFIHRDRLPADWQSLGYFRLAPDLAIEVISAHDLAYEVDAKTDQYLSAGVRMVWVINPVERMVQVHRQDGSLTKLRSNAILSGEDVVPGFTCLVADLFPAK